MSINNTHYGTDSLNTNTGANNSAFGAYAAYSNLDASNNTAVGSNSLFYNTTGSNNTSVGAGSLCNNDVGSLNTAIGSSALEGVEVNQSVGNQNVAVGAQALYSNTGDLNTSIGTYAAKDIIYGNYNTFLGANTSYNNTSGYYEYSTAIGYGAEIDADKQIMMGVSDTNVMIPGSAQFQTYDPTSYINLSIVAKEYVDTLASGLKPSYACVCATTASINSSSVPSGHPPTSYTDGVIINNGDYVLVINQGGANNTETSNRFNGLWIVNLSGNWSRPASGNMANGYDAVGSFSTILYGTIYGGKTLVQINDPGIVGINPLQYTILTTKDTLTAGRGLTISNNVISVDSSLNFINYLDNYAGPNPGTLNIGAYTTNTIIGSVNPVIMKSGVFGPTGTFNYVKVNDYIEFSDGSKQYIAGGGGDSNWNTSDNNIYNSNSGNVGVGTDTPAYKLDVNGSLNASGNASFTSMSASGDASFTSMSASGNASFNTMNASGNASFTTMSASGDASFNTMSSSGLSTLNQLSVTTTTKLSGNVSINKNTASYQLDVSGNIHANNNITSQTMNLINDNAIYYSQSTSLVPKKYVDAIASGINLKASCACATTQNYASWTYNGTSEFTNVSTSLTIDDYIVLSGDRVLVKDQTDAKSNGIYVYNTTNGTLTRSLDMPFGSNAKGVATFINYGNTYSKDTFVQTNYDNATGQAFTGITDLIFVIFSTINFSIGQGLVYQDNTLSVSPILDFLDTITTSNSIYVGGNIDISGNIDMTGNPNINYIEFPDGTKQYTAGLTGGNSFWNSIGTNNIVNSNVGNVGIGTSTTIPSYKLDINGTMRVSGLSYAPAGITGATGSFTYLKTTNNANIGGTLNVNGLITAPAGITGATGSFTYLKTTNNANIGGTLNVNGLITAPAGITGATGSFTYLKTTGNIVMTGIPNTNYIEFPDTTKQYTAAGNSFWDISGNNIYNTNDGGDGFVGIGTPEPRAPLEIFSDQIIYRSNLWTSRIAGANNSWTSVCYGNGLFVAVSSDGTIDNKVMTSPDGINWTSRSAAENNSWQSVCYGNGLFVAVSSDGTNRVMTSPDGINWTSRISGTDTTCQWKSVCYGNGLFVAVSLNGQFSNINRIIYSYDGITWVNTNAPETDPDDVFLDSVCYGNGKFVAVTSSDERLPIYSDDGIIWQEGNVSDFANWQSVCYGNGLFVAVSYINFNEAEQVMTSPDGINWDFTNAAENNNWRSVCYGNGLFVAVSDDNTGSIANRVMTSPDGINWTSRTSAADNLWLSVCYGNGLFVAVSSNGDYRVMTSGKQYQNIETTIVPWIVSNNNIISNFSGTCTASSFTSTGTCTASSFTTTSDYRIKENVKNLDETFSIDELRPVTYFNKNTEKQDMGFIAHEVQEIFPFLVHGNKDDAQIQSLNYNGFIALVVKEIQELKKEIQELKGK
jgi:hypothetical protein